MNTKTNTHELPEATTERAGALDLMVTLRRFHADESGATATEYMILLILVACFIIAAVKFFGQTVEEKYQWADERVYKFVTH